MTKKIEKSHPFGLFTPVREGPFATEQVHAKLQRIADYVDPDLTPEAVQRLWEVLQGCKGLEVRRKPGQKFQPEPNKTEHPAQ